MSNRPMQPIGYWLREADRAITEAVNRVQAANGVSRAEWQGLHGIAHAGNPSLPQRAEMLRPVVAASALSTILAYLTERGWVLAQPGAGAGAICLTEEGRRRHADILAQQQAVRNQAVDGVSAEEYATGIRVLERIVANLGGSAPA